MMRAGTTITGTAAERAGMAPVRAGQLYAETDTGALYMADEAPAWDYFPRLIPGDVTMTNGIFLTGGAASVVTLNDNVANAFTLVDAGGIEYLRVTTTDTQPIVIWNDGGADVDFYVEAAGGVADALFVRGADGQVTLGVLTAGYARSNAGGVLSVVTEIPLIDLADYTQGDLIYGDGADWQDLAIGAAYQILGVNVGGTEPEWQLFDWDNHIIAAGGDGVHDHSNNNEGGVIAGVGPHSLLDGLTHPDTVAQVVTRGSMIYGNLTPLWDELLVGGAHTLLKVNAGGTDPIWTAFDWDDISAAGGADMIHDHSAAGEGDEIPLASLGGYTQGDLVYGGGADWQDLAHPGAANRVLQSTAAEVGWSANAVTFPSAGAVPVGSGGPNQVAYWSAPNTLSGDAGLLVDAGNDMFIVADAGGIGNAVGTARLHFDSSGGTDYAYFLGCYVGIRTANPGVPLHVLASGAQNTLGQSIQALVSNAASSANERVELGFGYKSGTNVPALIGLDVQADGGAGLQKGDLYFATRDVVTDTAPTIRMTIKANGFIGMNTLNPACTLHVVRGTTDPLLMFAAYDNAQIPQFMSRRSRGTEAVPTDVVNGDVIGVYGTEAYSAAWFSLSQIRVEIDGGFISGQRPPSRLLFYTNVTNVQVAERLRVTGAGDVGLSTIPSRILDCNDGSGNMIADGYDTHPSWLSEKVDPVLMTNVIERLKNVGAYQYKRVPFVSADELTEAAVEEFGQERWDAAFPDGYRGGKLEECPDPEILAFLDNLGDQLRAERQPLPKWQRLHYSLAIDDLLGTFPDVVSRNDKDEVDGYSLNSYVGVLHGAIGELIDRVEYLEARLN